MIEHIKTRIEELEWCEKELLKTNAYKRYLEPIRKRIQELKNQTLKPEGDYGRSDNGCGAIDGGSLGMGA